MGTSFDGCKLLRLRNDAAEETASSPLLITSSIK